MNPAGSCPSLPSPLGSWRFRLAGPPGRWLGRFCWLLLACLAWLPASGARAGTVPGELPALVGRLSAVQGDVRWLDRDSGRWVASTASQPLRNWPVASGDRVRTGVGGRAELRIGSLTVRLGTDAELWLQRLDEQALLLHLEAGTLALRLPVVDGDAFGPLELSTREGRWLPQRPGSYRLDRQPDATQATAWQGEWRFDGRDSQLVVPAGRRADLWLDGPGSATAGRTRVAWAGVERDDFADWVARDERLDDAPVTARHVPPGMTGWQDLDRHGDWVSDPEVGSLWQPRLLAPGWAPFQDGRWAWVAPWGWTWIDAAPWGFAPFHYGSWLVIGGRWSWSPGPRHYRPRYAPALSVWLQAPVAGIGVQIGGGYRPPPPRVVMPVVVPIYVQRPGRPVVIVNTPVHRPWPERPGFSGPHGDDRPPGYGGRPGGDRPRGDWPRAGDHRTESQRPDGQRPEGQRPDKPRDDHPRWDKQGFEGPRPDGQRPEGPRPDGHRLEGRRFDGQRQEAQRPDAQQRPPPMVVAAPTTPAGPATPAGLATPAMPNTPAAPGRAEAPTGGRPTGSAAPPVAVPVPPAARAPAPRSGELDVAPPPRAPAPAPTQQAKPERQEGRQGRDELREVPGRKPQGNSDRARQD